MMRSTIYFALASVLVMAGEANPSALSPSHDLSTPPESLAVARSDRQSRRRRKGEIHPFQSMTPATPGPIAPPATPGPIAPATPGPINPSPGPTTNPSPGPTTNPSPGPTTNPTPSAPPPTDECDSKLFQQYNETGFKVASKNEAFTFITKIKTAFKAIKKSYRAAKTNLRKLGREAKE
jgi:predicted component of type VI protein secretion system